MAAASPAAAAPVTRELAAFVAGLQADRLSPELRERTRFLVLDLVGNIVRGRHDAESTAPLLAAARARSEERRVGKECHVVCRSRWSPYH